MHFFIIDGGDGAEAFLAGGVPDLHLHLLIVEVEGPLAELDPERGADVFTELVVREPVQQTRLPDALVTNVPLSPSTNIFTFLHGGSAMD